MRPGRGRKSEASSWLMPERIEPLPPPGKAKPAAVVQSAAKTGVWHGQRHPALCDVAENQCADKHLQETRVSFNLALSGQFRRSCARLRCSTIKRSRSEQSRSNVMRSTNDISGVKSGEHTQRWVHDPTHTDDGSTARRMQTDETPLQIEAERQHDRRSVGTQPTAGKERNRPPFLSSNFVSNRLVRSGQRLADRTAVRRFGGGKQSILRRMIVEAVSA